MNRAREPALALLAVAALLPCAGARAQARGPSALEIQENGQVVGDSEPVWASYLDQLSRQSGYPLADLKSSRVYWTEEQGFVLDRGELKFPLGKWAPPAPQPLDTASRISKNEEQQAWLTRLVGRFHLAGRAESWQNVRLGGADPTWVYAKTGGDISGIADCAAVGKGAGVQCILNATWPIVELGLPNLRDTRPLPSEAVRVFQPALMAFGINPDTAEISATMVSDDSIAHTWAGRLEANTLNARRMNDCVDPDNMPRSRRTLPPCFQPLEIRTQPDGTITMVHTYLGVTISLSMQRDPAARAGKPVKGKKTR